MDKEVLKEIASSLNASVSDAYSGGQETLITAAAAELKKHGRPQFLIDLICELWGVAVFKSIGWRLSQRFSFKRHFDTSDIISGETTVIGTLDCCKNIIDVCFSEKKNCFHFRNGTYIADNVQDLFRYMSSDENILPETIEHLTKAGWYQNRKMNISNIIAHFYQKGTPLSAEQIGFFEGFDGIKGKGNSGEEFEVYIDLKDFKFQKSIAPSREDLRSYSPLNIAGYNENTDFFLAGTMGNGIVPVWISTDGRLFSDMGTQMGRTVLEAFQDIIM